MDDMLTTVPSLDGSLERNSEMARRQIRMLAVRLMSRVLYDDDSVFFQKLDQS